MLRSKYKAYNIPDPHSRITILFLTELHPLEPGKTVSLGELYSRRKFSVLLPSAYSVRDIDP